MAGRATSLALRSVSKSSPKMRIFSKFGTIKPSSNVMNIKTTPIRTQIEALPAEICIEIMIIFDLYACAHLNQDYAQHIERRGACSTPGAELPGLPKRLVRLDAKP